MVLACDGEGGREKGGSRAMPCVPVFHLFFTGNGLRIRPRKRPRCLTGQLKPPETYGREAVVHVYALDKSGGLVARAEK